MSTYRSWNFSSVSFQQRASCRFCTSRATFFFMDVCLWWIPFIKIWWHLLNQNRRSIFDILFYPNSDDRLENTPQVFWVCGKRYSTDISSKCRGSIPKDKHPTCYLPYKLVNENCIPRTKALNKAAKNILQLSSRTFGRSPHFIRAIFGVYYFLLFSCSVIYFIAIIIGYKLGLVRTPKYTDYRPRRRYPGNNY